jgi:hypothetical protein
MAKNIYQKSTASQSLTHPRQMKFFYTILWKEFVSVPLFHFNFTADCAGMYGTFGAYRTCKEHITIDDGPRKLNCKPGDSIFTSFVSHHISFPALVTDVGIRYPLPRIPKSIHLHPPSVWIVHSIRILSTASVLTHVSVGKHHELH